MGLLTDTFKSILDTLFPRNPCSTNSCNHWCMRCHDTGLYEESWHDGEDWRTSQGYCDCPAGARLIYTQQLNKQEKDRLEELRRKGPPAADPYWGRIQRDIK